MSNTKKILTQPLRIFIVAMLIGLLMKILGWPMASQVMFVSFTTIGLLYGLRFWKKPIKQFKDYNKLILVLFWVINGVLSILDVQHTIFIHLVIAISFVLWFVLEGAGYLIHGNQHTKNSTLQLLWNIAMVFGTLAIIAGSLMKILNWEYALSLLVLGIVVVCAYVFRDTFAVEGLKNEDTNGEELQA
ncbi:hypothetical protein HZY62_15800 [Maribacter polysiphoniae]|uniref:Uncharacterized protein n=1 Tax=Maribacter polysiphoniae TaxID=429344 RepID=A0A316DVH5_9FLAO|nr:hypothetical protein [Maribacter polysiphoniae]MBD1262066.1 hypothetical protein [Maribacter polysiphoniae]PWK21756.1 hypothetical protein LX92_03536 [Maribacter polysiphoniae]